MMYILRRKLKQVDIPMQDVATLFMSLIVDRSRPLQQLNTAIDLNTILDEKEQFIWQQLNGKQTMQDITLAFADKFNIFAPDQVAACIAKLAKLNLVTQINQSKMHIAISNIDHYFSMRHKITNIGQTILSVLAVAGVFAFSFSINAVIETAKILPHVGLLLFCVIPFMFVSVILHELGRAFTTKALGYKIHYIGIGWSGCWPVAFADTSDLWLSTRTPRMIVNAAGISTNILFGGLSAFCIFAFSNPYIQSIFWLFSLVTYINALRMLNPLEERDGYYFLVDWLDYPHLRQSAITWLTKGFAFFRRHIPEAIYWGACLIFLILIAVITFYFQLFVFEIFDFRDSNFYLTLLLPVLVVLLASLSVISDIKE